jgi:hypothetical protein
MTVQELIDQLTDLPPDAEVRIAQQPRRPLEYDIALVAAVDPSTVYISEGSQIGYLLAAAAEELGWGR